jgi:flagellar protein FlaG
MEITNNQVNPVVLDGRVPTKASSVEAAPAAAKLQINQPEPVPASNSKEVSNGEALQSAVTQINDYMQNVERSLQFTVDEGSGKDVVTVLDKKTDEIIRQFPSEEVLNIARRITEQKDAAINLFSSQV